MGEKPVYCSPIVGNHHHAGAGLADWLRVASPAGREGTSVTGTSLSFQQFPENVVLGVVLRGIQKQGVREFSAPKTHDFWQVGL